MKILTVSHYQPLYGGAELLLYYLCRYMDRQGIKNTLVAPRIAPELREALNGSSTELVESGGGNKLAQIGSLSLAVGKLARDVDVINVHNFPATLSIKVNKPTVWMCNEPPEVFLGSIKESFISRIGRRYMIGRNKVWARNCVDTAIVADAVNKERFIRLYGYDPVIIPYGVDFDYWNVEERRMKDDEFMIMHVGTVTPLKNQLASVRAMVQVIKDIPNACLWLVGSFNEDAYMYEIRRTIDVDGLDGHVYFLGHRKREELRALYGRAHIVVHPIKPQGGWLTPFEALSCRVPVIVGSEATTVDLIRWHELGVIATEDELSYAIKGVYNHYENYQEKTNKAAEWVRDNLTWDLFSEHFMNAMRGAMARAEYAATNKVKEWEKIGNNIKGERK